MNTLYQVLFVLIAIPVVLLCLYAITRIVSLACLHSWWDTKLWYTGKVLDKFKDNPPKGEEGDHGITGQKGTN